MGFTCSKKDRDLLMNKASLAMAPTVPVFELRSEPARSTMFSLLRNVCPSASPSHTVAVTDH